MSKNVIAIIYIKNGKTVKVAQVFVQEGKTSHDKDAENEIKFLYKKCVIETNKPTKRSPLMFTIKHSTYFQLFSKRHIPEKKWMNKGAHVLIIRQKEQFLGQR